MPCPGTGLRAPHLVRVPSWTRVSLHGHYQPELLPTPREWVGARFLTQETLATLLNLSLRARDARARLDHANSRRDEPTADLARRDLNDLTDQVLAVTLREWPRSGAPGRYLAVPEPRLDPHPARTDAGERHPCHA